jgi:hypothetical protein
VTPILVRPVREQLEHDRVIRLLQQRWRRKYAVGINVGSDTVASVGQPGALIYPDVVLAPLGKPNKPEIVVEVETAESVNSLEAMAEWLRMGQLKTAFHLYVPAGSVDPARRLCTELAVPIDEIWTYHPIGDQIRFTMVYKAPEPSRSARRSAAQPAAAPKSRPARPAAAKRKAPARAATRGGKAPAGKSARRATARKAAPRKSATPARKAGKAGSAARKRR